LNYVYFILEQLLGQLENKSNKVYINEYDNSDNHRSKENKTTTIVKTSYFDFKLMCILFKDFLSL